MPHFQITILKLFKRLRRKRDSESSQCTTICAPAASLHPTISYPEPTTFHSFPNLPTELRLEIWRLAMSPRLVRFPIAMKISTDEPSSWKPCVPDPETLLSTVILSTSNSLPLLSVNREARLELLSFCPPSFEFTRISRRKRSHSPPKKDVIFKGVSFNASIDTLYIEDTYIANQLAYSLGTGIETLRHLCVPDPPASTPISMDQRFLFLAGLLTHFPRLQTLCVVLPYPPAGHSDGTNSERTRCEKYREWLERKLIEFWYLHGMHCWNGVRGLGITRDEVESFSHTKSGLKRFITEGPRWERALRVKWARDVEGEVEGMWGGDERELSTLAQEYLRIGREHGLGMGT